MLKVQEIREIIKLIDESSVQEFEYESGDSKVTLKKHGGSVPVAEAQPVVQAPSPVQEAAPVRQENTSVEEQPSNEKNKAEEKVQESKTEASADYDYEVTSPMVGTIYHAPAPEDDPYVQVGDRVSNDSVVCIVEAMKLFNEIEAEVSGEIVEILVSDGDLVEYNQPLFRVKR
ncbi:MULTISPECIES: acetyl-CoA carboxylase biotin carboxyl carrier protein [Salimicrobium]|uniref:Biotin carboxyl carrier protein of acetyl-CoA carboxylase n=2 Tax=Salimicrobium TaxID=351195 RepID=A0ABY1KTG1_9BACI|nr:MULTISPECIES: acetyl-CoA carboxylase biotin carboxyl carrier protein [Salimicrobium]SDX69603.1 acetyl-CoA carboxylase biotin carboxyl carrier protein [Salimicrobium album]SIS53895.1 biotin carboxyl carrier protein [Salimicrobium salexigens]